MSGITIQLNPPTSIPADGMVVLYCETAMTDPMGIAKAIKAAVSESGIKNKPVPSLLLAVNACSCNPMVG